MIFQYEFSTGYGSAFIGTTLVVKPALLQVANLVLLYIIVKLSYVQCLYACLVSLNGSKFLMVCHDHHI